VRSSISAGIKLVLAQESKERGQKSGVRRGRRGRPVMTALLLTGIDE